MQAEAPEAFDLASETEATLRLYGLQRGSTQGFAWQCLVARRLAERGVRFIELIDTGASNNWDSHGDMNDHGPLAQNVDQPIAGLLKDLKSRGMLDETLVVWTTEFGRTPFNTGRDARGREHHAEVFASWMAGGGVKGGISYGESDEHGCTVAANEVHIHDFHATILHLLGLDHERLDLSACGPRFPPHRCGRPRGPRDSRLTQAGDKRSVPADLRDRVNSPAMFLHLYAAVVLLEAAGLGQVLLPHHADEVAADCLTAFHAQPRLGQRLHAFGGNVVATTHTGSCHKSFPPQVR